MSKDIKSRLGKWAAVITGVLVMLKSLIFVVSRIFRLTKSEVNSRGSDVNFVLGLADRRRTGH